MEKKKILNAVVISAVSMGVIATSTQALAEPKCPVEKCYGIAKKMKNECGTSKHACAAQSTVNSDPNDWIYVMKGNCKMITGGHLHAPKSMVVTPAKK